MQKPLHGPPCHWWSDKCNREVRLRKADLSKFKCTDLHSDFIEYKKSVAKARREIRRVKQESFCSFCERLRKDTDPSFAWKTVKKFQSRFNCSKTKREYSPEKKARIREQIEELKAE